MGEMDIVKELTIMQFDNDWEITYKHINIRPSVSKTDGHLKIFISV